MRFLFVLSVLLSMAIACIPMKVTANIGCPKITAHDEEYCKREHPGTPGEPRCSEVIITPTSVTCKEDMAELVVGTNGAAKSTITTALECSGVNWKYKTVDGSWNYLESALKSGPVVSGFMAVFLTFSIFLLLFGFSAGQYVLGVLEPQKKELILRCDATAANFGADVKNFTSGLKSAGCAFAVSPEDACKPVKIKTEEYCRVNYAVVPMGNCNTSEKAYFVQHASPRPFDALIVYNGKDHLPVNMTGGKYAELVRIPVVMINYDCMLDILGRYSADKGYTVRFYFEDYGLLQVIVIGILASIIGVYLLKVLFGKLCPVVCEWWRRVKARRLLRRLLKTKIFMRGDQPDTCVICMDEFIEREKLRVLPCNHLFHCTCIDTWLANHRMECPLCKRGVGLTDSDSELLRREVARNPPSASTVPNRDLEEGQTSTSSSREEVMENAGSTMMLIPSTSSQVHENAEVSSSRERLVDLEGAGSGTVQNGTLRALRSFAGRLTASSSRTQGGEGAGGVDNPSFEGANRRSDLDLESDQEYRTPSSSPVGDILTSTPSSANLLDEITH